MKEKDYQALVEEMAPKSPMGRDCFNAFWIGGLICAIGQGFLNFYTKLGLEKDIAGTAMSMTLPRMMNSLNSPIKPFFLPAIASSLS